MTQKFPTPTPAAPLSPLPTTKGDGHGSDDAADLIRRAG